MEAEAALVGTYGTVHLHAVAAVDVYLSPVVRPGHAEHYHALGLDHSLEDLEIHEVRIGDHIVGYTLDNLSHRLVEFALTGVPCDQLRHEPLDIILGKLVHKQKVIYN